MKLCSIILNQNTMGDLRGADGLKQVSVFTPAHARKSMYVPDARAPSMSEEVMTSGTSSRGLHPHA